MNDIGDIVRALPVELRRAPQGMCRRWLRQAIHFFSYHLILRRRTARRTRAAGFCRFGQGSRSDRRLVLEAHLVPHQYLTAGVSLGACVRFIYSPRRYSVWPIFHGSLANSYKFSGFLSVLEDSIFNRIALYQ
jgi:hypothetical protein